MGEKVTNDHDELQPIARSSRAPRIETPLARPVKIRPIPPKRLALAKVPRLFQSFDEFNERSDCTVVRALPYTLNQIFCCFVAEQSAWMSQAVISQTLRCKHANVADMIGQLIDAGKIDQLAMIRSVPVGTTARAPMGPSRYKVYDFRVFDQLVKAVRKDNAVTKAGLKWWRVGNAPTLPFHKAGGQTVRDLYREKFWDVWQTDVECATQYKFIDYFDLLDRFRRACVDSRGSVQEMIAFWLKAHAILLKRRSCMTLPLGDDVFSHTADRDMFDITVTIPDLCIPTDGETLRTIVRAVRAAMVSAGVEGIASRAVTMERLLEHLAQAVTARAKTAY